MSELSGINKGAIYCEETDLTVFCGLGGKLLLSIKAYEESGEEATNCSKGFCTFDSFLGCSDERFFGY